MFRKHPNDPDKSEGQKHCFRPNTGIIARVAQQGVKHLEAECCLLGIISQ